MVVIAGVVTKVVDVGFEFFVEVIATEVVLMASVVAVVMGRTTLELVNELLLLAWGMSDSFVDEGVFIFVVEIL